MKPKPDVAGALGEGAEDGLLEQPSCGQRYRYVTKPECGTAYAEQGCDIALIELEAIPAIPMLERKAEDLHPWPKGVLDAR